MPVRILRRHDGQPASVPHRDVVLLLEPEDVGVEPEGLLLVVNQHARHDDLHQGLLPSVWGQRSMISWSGDVSRWWNL